MFSEARSLVVFAFDFDLKEVVPLLVLLRLLGVGVVVCSNLMAISSNFCW
jgi:hypothetical protein